MGSFSMGILWFSIFLMPVFQIAASIGLITLFFFDAPLAWTFFQGFWIIAAIVYAVVTFASFAVDPESARRTWRAMPALPVACPVEFSGYRSGRISAYKPNTQPSCFLLDTEGPSPGGGG